MGNLPCLVSFLSGCKRTILGAMPPHNAPKSTSSGFPFWLILVLALTVAGVQCINPAFAQSSRALSAADWDAGNIISDSIFFNGEAMSAGEVQSFLDSKMPSCLPMSYVGPGNIGAYIAPEDRRECLNRYSMTTSTVIDPDGFCSPFYGSANDSAASILYKVGKACNVSQKALLVLLQKEQGLVTDNWPEAKQYDRATGYACYDNPFRCDPAFAGFFKQMYFGARQFQRYNNVDGLRFYPVGQWSNILWSTNSACGTGPVYIKNRATAALYYYTPYQPNAVALSDLTRSPNDGCSQFGNRNFWLTFTTWFGSTQVPDGVTEFVRALYSDVLGRSPDAGGLQYWVDRFVGGMSRSEIADVFYKSDEFRLKMTREAYHLAFNRDPDLGGQSYWMNELRNNRVQPEDLHSLFASSPEMYFSVGGGTNLGYVNALYRNLLGRDPDSGGLSYWVGKLSSGEPRKAISDAIAGSPERNDRRVVQAYKLYFGRTPGSPEISYWVGYAKTNGVAAMRKGLLGSDEYFRFANVRF